MGFRRVDRSPKPAGLTLARFFESGAIDLGFNNGFEKADSSTLPLNWSIRSFAQAKFARDTAVKHSGSASVSITASANKPVWSPAFTISPVKFIESGKNYRATVWARGLHVTGPARLALDWFDASAKRDISWHVGSAQQLISESPSANLKQGDSDWTQLTVSATAPTNAAFVLRSTSALITIEARSGLMMLRSNDKAQARCSTASRLPSTADCHWLHASFSAVRSQPAFSITK